MVGTKNSAMHKQDEGSPANLDNLCRSSPVLLSELLLVRGRGAHKDKAQAY